jgi:hypothetical protein
LARATEFDARAAKAPGVSFVLTLLIVVEHVPREWTVRTSLKPKKGAASPANRRDNSWGPRRWRALLTKGNRVVAEGSQDGFEDR